MQIADPALRDELNAMVAEARAEQDWWTERWPSLLRLYPDEFVVVRGDAVIAHERRITDALDRVETLGLTMRDVHMRFIDADPSRLIL